MATSKSPAFEHPLLGVGLYSVVDVAHILRERPRRMSRWVRGYEYLTTQGKVGQRPYFERDFADFEQKVVLSFADLIELRFIQMFRQKGVRPQTIRLIHDALSQRYEVTHPFSVRRVRTDGRTLYEVIHSDKDDKRTCEDLLTSQMVFTELAEDFFLKLEYEGDRELAARYWPLGRSKKVVVDPERSFGKPIEDVSGVPTYVIYGMHKAGETVADIADWYDVSEEGVADAIAYETERLPLPKAA